MDVQTIATPPAAAAGTQPSQPEVQAPASADVAGSSQLPVTPTSTVDGVPLPPQNGTIAGAVAKLFGPASGAPQPLNLNVTYRVEPHSNNIVTVFSDPRTGKEVAQFPPEILIGISQFFDQHQGTTLDHNA